MIRFRAFCYQSWRVVASVFIIFVGGTPLIRTFRHVVIGYCSKKKKGVIHICVVRDYVVRRDFFRDAQQSNLSVCYQTPSRVFARSPSSFHTITISIDNCDNVTTRRQGPQYRDNDNDKCTMQIGKEGRETGRGSRCDTSRAPGMFLLCFFHY